MNQIRIVVQQKVRHRTPGYLYALRYPYVNDRLLWLANVDLSFGVEVCPLGYSMPPAWDPEVM